MGRAIFMQRSGILGVAVVSDCGVVSAEQLIKLGELAKRIKVHGIKFTTRQTVVFLINREDYPVFRAEIENTGLKMGAFGNLVRNVKGCPGNDTLCQRSHGDAYALAIKIQNRFMNQPVPKDFKISVAGCNRGCTDPYCADFGVIAVGQDSFTIYIGGRGGGKNPVHGKLVLERVSSEGVTETLEHVLNTYRELAMPFERLCTTLQRCGDRRFMPLPPSCKKPRAALTDDLQLAGGDKHGREITSGDDLFNRINLLKTALNACCLGETTCQPCIGDQCVIGFAKTVADYIAAQNVLVIHNGLKMAPRENGKLFEKTKVAHALAIINVKCKNCMDNHEEDCPINIIRYSLEEALLGRHIEFAGSSVAYIKALIQIDAELGNQVKQNYFKLNEEAKLMEVL